MLDIETRGIAHEVGQADLFARVGANVVLLLPQTVLQDVVVGGFDLPARFRGVLPADFVGVRFALDLDTQRDRYTLGRALYHLAQRRGFLSTRKDAGETREQRLLEYVEANPCMTVAGLREGCILRVENGRIELIGERPMRIFRKGQAPYEVRPGDDLNFLLD